MFTSNRARNDRLILNTKLKEKPTSYWRPLDSDARVTFQRYSDGIYWRPAPSGSTYTSTFTSDFRSLLVLD